MLARIVRTFAPALALAASGCFAFHDSYPDRSCVDDNQCFRAQGEFCDLATKTCVVRDDATALRDAGPTPDTAPTPDAAAPDVTADASPPDAT